MTVRTAVIDASHAPPSAVGEASGNLLFSVFPATRVGEFEARLIRETWLGWRAIEKKRREFWD